MGELLCKNQQLPVRNFQLLCGRCRYCAFSSNCCRRCTYHLDPDRYALLCFNLVNGNPAILAVQNSLDETALRVTRAISKLWHPVWTLVQNGRSEERRVGKECRASRSARRERD